MSLPPRSDEPNRRWIFPDLVRGGGGPQKVAGPTELAIVDELERRLRLGLVNWHRLGRGPAEAWKLRIGRVRFSLHDSAGYSSLRIHLRFSADSVAYRGTTIDRMVAAQLKREQLEREPITSAPRTENASLIRSVRRDLGLN